MLTYSAMKNSGEPHPRVLGVIAGDQLALGLRQVEGDAVRLGVAGDREQDEPKNLPAPEEDVPVPEHSGLLLDDRGRPERS